MPITTFFVAKVPRGTLGFDVNLILPMWDLGNGCGTLGMDVGLWELMWDFKVWL